jgi:REP element-mobilizing transposase RayT
VHVTLRAGLGSLRSQFLFPTVRLALARATRRDPNRFRVVEFSVQSNHLHLIVEASDRRALSSGVRGLAVRIARYVNELLMRRGPFWADRWHGRALTSPREVRQGLVYVLANLRKHAVRPLPPGIDPCSSGAWFAGFRGYVPGRGDAPFVGRAPPPAALEVGVPVEPARGFLLSVAWRRHGLIGLAESPGGASLRGPAPRAR